MDAETDEMERAVTEGDTETLAALVYEARHSARRMLRLLDQMRQLAHDRPWLARLLRQQGHAWFFVFKQTQPRELLAAYEYDFLARGAETRRSSLMARLECAVDDALCVRYYGHFGLVQYSARGLYGAALLLALAPHHSVERLLALEPLCFDDALLNPPRARLGEWLGFHARMRRAAFLVLRGLLRALDRDEPEAAQHQSIVLALGYAQELRTRMWRDDEDEPLALDQMAPALRRAAGTPAFAQQCRDFFASARVVAAVPDWARLVDDALQQSATPWADAEPLLQQWASETEARGALDAWYGFVYTGTPEQQAAFQARVTHGLNKI